MTSAIRTEGHLAAPADRDRKNYQRLFRMTFPFFLALAVVGRMIPHAGENGLTRAGDGSLVDEAQRMSSKVLPFVFVR